MAFTSLPRLDRRSRMRELAALAAGARILNWDLHGGGFADSQSVLEDLPSALARALDATVANLEAAATHADDKIRRWVRLQGCVRTTASEKSDLQ